MIKFSVSPEGDRYTATLDGVLLGEVRKKVTHYNLRRSVTVIEWVPTKADGTRLPSCRTRQEAGESLRP